MPRPSVGRRIAAPLDVVWDLLTDVSRWSEWGPTVRDVRTDTRRIGAGSTGTVIGPLGLRAPFRVTEFEPRRSWAWRVAGIPATGHHLTPAGPEATVVRFTTPLIASPYLAVCRVALRRLDALATPEADR